MDSNGDGVLDPSEIPEERRGFFSFMAGRMGIDASKPVAIDQAVEAVRARSSGGDPSRPPGSESSDKKPESKADAKAASPLVEGFGVEIALTPVPGFGTDAGITPTANLDPALRAYAESMLQRYDTNHNGVLDREEWGQMRRDPTPADRNQDGRVTLEELAAWRAERDQGRASGQPGEGSPGGFPGGFMGGFMGGYDAGPPSETSNESSASDSAKSESTPSSTSSAGNSRKSYRFRSPTERLPQGLPEWFASRDANSDGQVSMAEYSGSWSDTKAQEFEQIDVNADGVITPQECLRGSLAGGTAAGPPPAGMAAAPATGGVAPAATPSPSAATGPAGAGTGASPASPAEAKAGANPPDEKPSGEKAKAWWLTL